MTERALILVSAPKEAMDEVLRTISNVDQVRVIEVGEVYRHSLFTFNFSENKLSANGSEAILTPRDSRLMQILSSLPNVPISTGDLALQLLGTDIHTASDPNVVRVGIRRLRRKFTDLIGEIEIIRTLSKHGYMLVDPCQ